MILRMVEKERSLTAFVAGITKISSATLQTSERKFLAADDKLLRYSMISRRLTAGVSVKWVARFLIAHPADWHQAHGRANIPAGVPPGTHGHNMHSAADLQG